jgi:hypothetical protein
MTFNYGSLFTLTALVRPSITDADVEYQAFACLGCRDDCNNLVVNP